MSQNDDNTLYNNILNQYAESKRIIQQAMDDHQLVLFVGAGASIASGMPSWGDAIQNIANRLSISDKDLDYLRIPQYYFNARGKKEYTQLIREIFRHGDYLPKHEIHDKIIEFDTATIITTNYDHLIEQAAEDNSQILSVVSKDADLPYRQGGKELIKMHGDFENDNFVLKEDDYLSYGRNFKLIENYVKSLIGTKVVLFIGYSFNDPDLKLIFSWVKDILGGDFQRAYLIQSGKKYDVNEAEYFRNFGINVLYASVQLQSLFDSDDLTSNLLLMLKWLLDKDKNDKLTCLYNELKPFSSMRYASQIYVKNALLNAGMNSSNGIISINDTFGRMSDDETKEIFKSLVYEQWIRLGNAVTLSIGLLKNIYVKTNLSEEEIEEKQKQNNIRVAEYIKDFKPNKKTQRIVREILDVLNKSNMVCLQGHLPRQGANSWFVASVPLYETASPSWMEAVNTFDFDSLEKVADENEAHLTETRPELYMEQGYLQFVLGNYLAAYNCYRNAKTIFYKRHEYVRFFIAEFNRYVLAKSIISGNGIICGIKSDDVKTVKAEMESLKLDRMFNSLPDLGETNKALKDMYTFNIAYTLFQDAYQVSAKVNEQANTNYTFFSGMAAFAGMSESISDYYNYISLNMLPVNNYLEHVNIFRIYFQSIVSSATAKDNTNATSLVENLKTVHASTLTTFDVLTALKFIEAKELEKMMNRLSSKLPLSDDAIEYLSIVVGNCIKRIPKSDFMYDTTFWKCLALLGKCNLNEQLVEITTNKLNEITTGLDYRDRSNMIKAFFVNARKQELLVSDKSTNNIVAFLDNILLYLSNNKSESLGCRSLVTTLLWGLKGSSRVYENTEIIRSLIADDTRLLCLSMYPFLTTDGKKMISDAYSNWKYDNSNFAFEFYYELVSKGVKKPDTNIEKKIVDYYDAEDEDSGNVLNGVMIFPAQNEKVFLYQLLDLYTKGLVIDKGACSKVLIKNNIPGCEWLMNYEGYDYSSFDTKWLSLCTDNLLETISKNENAKENIKRAIEDEYKTGSVDKDLVDIYFRFFI